MANCKFANFTPPQYHTETIDKPSSSSYLYRMSLQNPVRYLDPTTPPHTSTLILLAGIAALTMNVFLPSLPNMAAHFETDYRIMQLSLAIYLGFSAGLQIIIGPISDKIGRRPVILWGLALFILATLGCLFAPNITVFLIFRMSQAVIATAMVLSRAVVRDIYPTEKAASMIGYVTMGMSVVPMIGPAVGGLLQDSFGWKASFWMLLISGALLFLICLRDLGETKSNSGNSLIDQFREYPELLTSPRFWGYTMASAFTAGTFFVYLGGAPFVGATLFDLSPSTLGIFFGAPASGYFLGNFITARFSQRIGINAMIAWGGVICAAGGALIMLLFAIGFENEYVFFSFMTFVGLGNGMSIPNATAGALSVRPHLAGTAAGLSSAMMIGIGAALSALSGSLLSPDTGAYPLLWLMVISASLGIASIFIVIWRTRQIAD